VTRGSRALALAFVTTLGLGCRPTLDDRPWLVRGLQIVSVHAAPPEAAPGSTVTLDVVALDPAGPVDTTMTSWTLCRSPKPLDEDRVVSAACLAPAAADAVGSPVAITIPADACRVFGPDIPQPKPGAPPTRPRDPDASGGYFQPLTIALGASLAVGLERIRCDLPDASLAAARAYLDTYQPNQNPALAPLAFSVDGAPADPAAVPAGARLHVEASWPAGTAEPFPLFDRSTDTVVPTVETLAVSWFATGGTLDRAAAEIDDPTVLATATTWQAPGGAGAFEIVVVLRDSRGGSDTARVSLMVSGS
jgi:hypothetical protein